jgi:hypothetical protein
MSSHFTAEQALSVGFSLACRAGFFSLCRAFVKRTLLADLQQVITDEDLSLDDDAGFELSRTRAPRRSPLPRTHSELPKPRHPRWATIVFCLAFSESCVLCSIVVLENAVAERLDRLSFDCRG